jgi:probable phosphoglycerate mutase
MLPGTIIFLRHGETDWNVAGRLQGQRDIPLNAHGRSQARRNGERILETIPEIAGFDFVASPLGRARETMEIARSAMGLNPGDYRLDDRLRELTFGEWEGFTTDELRVDRPDAVAEREARKWEFVPPGGESYGMLANRVSAWLETLDRPVMAVSHGGVGRVLYQLLEGVERAAAANLDFPQDRFLLWQAGPARWI